MTQKFRLEVDGETKYPIVFRLGRRSMQGYPRLLTSEEASIMREAIGWCENTFGNSAESRSGLHKPFRWSHHFGFGRMFLYDDDDAAFEFKMRWG